MSGWGFGIFLNFRFGEFRLVGIVDCTSAGYTWPLSRRLRPVWPLWCSSSIWWSSCQPSGRFYGCLPSVSSDKASNIPHFQHFIARSNLNFTWTRLYHKNKYISQNWKWAITFPYSFSFFCKGMNNIRNQPHFLPTENRCKTRLILYETHIKLTEILSCNT